MKLPTLQQVLQESGRTFQRFPLVLTSAIAGTLAALILIDYEGPPGSSVLFNVLFASILGVPLLLAIAVAAEKYAWSRARALGAQAIGVLLLTGYALAVPSSLNAAPLLHIQRLLILTLACHLLAAVAPYASRGHVNGFWQYNRVLLFRVLQALLYSAVLNAGLAIALPALDQLFGLSVPAKRYAELSVLILGVFNTWFFLGGVPRFLNELDRLTDYPRGLKVLAQYILSGLLVIYLIILYAYLAKVIIQWDWPQGWVSKLTFGFAGTGMLSILLLYPVRDQTGNVWIQVATRWFWLVMIPPATVLQLAIWRRVADYGVTVDRYIALVLGAWLAGMIVYFVLSRAKSIKVIPTSLAALCLLASFGPWGVFAVSEGSQADQLRQLLTDNGILVDGRVSAVRAPVSVPTARRISSIVDYLREFHGYDRIQPWFSVDLKQDSAGTGRSSIGAELVLRQMGVKYSPSAPYMGGPLALVADLDQPISVGGYDHMLVARRLARDALSGNDAENNFA